MKKFALFFLAMFSFFNVSANDAHDNLDSHVLQQLTQRYTKSQSKAKKKHLSENAYKILLGGLGLTFLNGRIFNSYIFYKNETRPMILKDKSLYYPTLSNNAIFQIVQQIIWGSLVCGLAMKVGVDLDILVADAVKTKHVSDDIH